MSRTVDLFISSDAPLAELADTIAERAGLAAPTATATATATATGDEPGAEGELGWSDGDVAAVLRANAYADNGDLVLRPYRYVLSTCSTASGHLGLSPETALLRRVAAALSDHRVLLVLDLQYRGEPREESP